MMATRLDSRFLSVVVHDLRNPLNVIGLSLRMIEEELPAEGSEEAREDLKIVRENVIQLTNMLSYLGDFARLVDDPPNGNARARIDPRILAKEAIEELGGQYGGLVFDKVRIEVQAGCPDAVTIDPIKSRLALRYALANALSSAGNVPVRLLIGGQEDRLRVEVALDRPPRSTVRSTDLAVDHFERLIGNDAERRGLDLMVDARACEILGGSARLEARDGEGTSIVIEWPATA